MSEEKPVHIPRGKYPELIYPATSPPSIIGYSDEESVHLLEYWRVILARRWTVIAVLLTVVTTTVIWTFKQIPIYQAQVTIQIDRENPNVLSFKDVYEVETANDDTLRTQFEVLKSRSLARRVIEDLHLDKSPEFMAAEPDFIRSYYARLRSVLSSATSSIDDSDPLRSIVGAYLYRLQVSRVSQARLATVTFESTNPQLAARIINAHAKHFIEQNFEYKWEATQQATAFLSQQLVSLKSNLEKAEDRLQAYSRENQILFTQEGHNTATEKLQQLEKEYTEAQANRFAKESYDRLVRDGNTDVLPQLMNNQLSTTLAGRLAELQREESELAVTFSPEYPRRKRLRSQIEEIEKTVASEKLRVIKTVQADYSASVERERLFFRALEEQREAVNRLNQEIIQYNILKREVDSNKQLYDGLLTRLKEAGVSAGLRASNIRVVDGAEVPQVPVSPRKSLNLALGLATGLVFGIGLALLQEYMDDSIKSAEDISRYLNAPTLGLIPRLGSLADRRGYAYGYLHTYTARKDQVAIKSPEPKLDVIAHEAPSSLMAEAYRSVRTSLLLSSPDHPPKLVLVTSAAPSEGKTVTAVNTAISLTQTGARVALIDADMRKPRVHTVFDLDDPIGLSSVLTGSANLKTAIKECIVPNLFVIPCGVTPPNPAELILSNRFRQLLQTLSQYFDYIVLDSPPISNVSDARILAAVCDATILVVKANSTARHQACRAIDYLHESRACVAGVVLNDLDVRAVGSYYSYYYAKYSYSKESETGRS